LDLDAAILAGMQAYPPVQHAVPRLGPHAQTVEVGPDRGSVTAAGADRVRTPNAHARLDRSAFTLVQRGDILSPGS
jgi:hypothetical protein